jgi:two-component system cell cycle sensor histidine kinase/response regulator CckA
MLPKTILIVDDEEIVRKLVRVALRESDGADVLEAHDAIEALEISEAHHGRIDLLLSDVVMPGGMSGAEMATKVSDAHPETKVLLMSGYEVETLAMKPEWHFIQKPFAVAEIRETIRNVLGGKSAA